MAASVTRHDVTATQLESIADDLFLEYVAALTCEHVSSARVKQLLAQSQKAERIAAQLRQAETTLTPSSWVA
ncbi:MAG: hypothetical protein HY329_19930 [Chloroflexi bacterium]|nr:hypothetical protein [Chloroflexota bacterium]